MWLIWVRKRHHNSFRNYKKCISYKASLNRWNRVSEDMKLMQLCTTVNENWLSFDSSPPYSTPSNQTQPKVLKFQSFWSIWFILFHWYINLNQQKFQYPNPNMSIEVWYKNKKEKQLMLLKCSWCVDVSIFLFHN